MLGSEGYERDRGVTVALAIERALFMRTALRDATKITGRSSAERFALTIPARRMVGIREENL